VLPSSCKFCFASVFLRYHACFGRLFYFVGAALSKKQWEKRAAESAQVAKIAVLEVVAISQVDKIAKLEATYID
jgi:surface polysaccharide O-acyltransferase-like enzyme